MPGADGPALVRDILRSLSCRTGDELVVAQRETTRRRWRIGHVCLQSIVFRHEALQSVSNRFGILARLVTGRPHSHTPPQRKIVGSGIESGASSLLAIGIEETLDGLCRIEASADLDPASSGSSRGVFTDNGGPARGMRLLQRPRQEPQIGK